MRFIYKRNFDAIILTVPVVSSLSQNQDNQSKQAPMSAPDPNETNPNKASGTFKNHDIEDTIVTDGGTSNFKKPVNIRRNETIYAGEDSRQSGNTGRSHTYAGRPTVQSSILTQGGTSTFDGEVTLTRRRVIVPRSAAFGTQQPAPAEQAGIVSLAFDTLLYYLAAFFG